MKSNSWPVWFVCVLGMFAVVVSQRLTIERLRDQRPYIPKLPAFVCPVTYAGPEEPDCDGRYVQGAPGSQIIYDFQTSAGEQVAKVAISGPLQLEVAGELMRQVDYWIPNGVKGDEFFDRTLKSK